MRLNEALAVPRGVTALVGGGGKTSLLLALARELSETARVLVITTAHIWPPPFETLLSPTRAAVLDAFARTNLLAAGDPGADGKLSEAAALGRDWAWLADYVLVEADGSRGLPLKAPAEHEPALPEGAALVIAVAGMGCAGQTVAQAAHRPELYAALTGLAPDAVVTPDAVAGALLHPNGQHRGVTGRFSVLLNQADTPERLAFAREVARLLPCDAVIAALQSLPGFVELWRAGRPVGMASGAQAQPKPEGE